MIAENKFVSRQYVFRGPEIQERREDRDVSEGGSSAAGASVGERSGVVLPTGRRGSAPSGCPPLPATPNLPESTDFVPAMAPTRFLPPGGRPSGSRPQRTQ